MKYPVSDPPMYADSDYKSKGGKIIKMSPDKFLSMSPPLDVDEASQDNIDDLADMMKAGREIDPPTLYMDGDDVSDHDGRHRAYAAKQLGINEIPVLIIPNISEAYEKVSYDDNYGYVTDEQLISLEHELDRLFADVDIDIVFTKHFMERVRDERNKRDITIDELRSIFRQTYVKYKDELSRIGPDFDGMIRSRDNVNIPFTLKWDERNQELDLVNKTIMRKKNFHNDDKKFYVNEIRRIIREEVEGIINEKKYPKKYMTKDKKAMKDEIGKHAKKSDDDSSAYGKWPADYKGRDTKGGERYKTKKSAATKAYEKKYGKNESINEDEKSDKALKNKSKDSGIPVGILKQVYNRGMAAWKTGHRPGTAQGQWAMGRVNSFITGSGGARKADDDLWKKAKKAKDKKKKNESVDYSEWEKGITLQLNESNIKISENLKYHIENKIPLGKSVFRYGSDKYFDTIREAKQLSKQGLIELNENDQFIVDSFMDEKVKIKDIGEVYLEHIYESEDGIWSGKEVNDYIRDITPDSNDLPDYFMNNIIKDRNFRIEEIDLNKLLLTDESFKEYYDSEEERYGEYDDEIDDYSIDNELVVVDGELLDGYSRAATKLRNGENFADAFVAIQNNIDEAEYKGKKVELGKPKRGGSKKFYVYVKNPKTNKIKKVSFGAKSGGGNLAVKLKDPKARKAFADRHNCEQKNDKTKPGYWACRLPRYAKSLGLSGGGTWW